MSIGAILASGLSQYVLSTSNSNQLRQVLRTLQNSLSTGDLNGASAALQNLQSVFQNSATTSGTTLSSSPQLSTDLAALGSAIGSGDVSIAQSAFATIQNDLNNTSSPSQTNESAAASQSVQLVQELLSTVNFSSSDSSSSNNDLTNSVLEQVYGIRSGLNMHG
jgi:hypothetical protein